VPENLVQRRPNAHALVIGGNDDAVGQGHSVIESSNDYGRVSMIQ
jgi:hypothetical protein